METTVKSAATHSSGVVGTAVATAAIAFGMMLLAVSATTSDDCDEMDTTKRLLSGGNRNRTLAALAQFEKGQFTERSIIGG